MNLGECRKIKLLHLKVKFFCVCGQGVNTSSREFKELCSLLYSMWYFSLILWFWCSTAQSFIDYLLTLLLMGGGLRDPPLHFLSFISHKWSILLFPSNSKFGHMSSLYDQDQKKFKNLNCIWATQLVTKWSKYPLLREG